MVQQSLKYKGSLTLGKLEQHLEADEQGLGHVVKLESLGGMSVATFDDDDFPARNSLALLPSIGGMPAPSPAHASHLFEGEATVLGAKMGISIFRTT
jgi:hypothetical protein